MALRAYSSCLQYLYLSFGQLEIKRPLDSYNLVFEWTRVINRAPARAHSRHGCQAATGCRHALETYDVVEKSTNSPALSKPIQPREWSCGVSNPGPEQAPSFMCWGTTTVMGFEPTISSVTERRFEPLSYTVIYSGCNPACVSLWQLAQSKTHLLNSDSILFSSVI